MAGCLLTRPARLYDLGFFSPVLPPCCPELQRWGYVCAALEPVPFRWHFLVFSRDYPWALFTRKMMFIVALHPIEYDEIAVPFIQ